MHTENDFCDFHYDPQREDSTVAKKPYRHLALKQYRQSPTSISKTIRREEKQTFMQLPCSHTEEGCCKCMIASSTFSQGCKRFKKFLQLGDFHPLIFITTPQNTTLVSLSKLCPLNYNNINILTQMSQCILDGLSPRFYLKNM